MKSWEDRWDATIAYLNDTSNIPLDNNGVKLGDHIESVVKDPDDRESISRELSLGKRSKTVYDDATYKETNTSKRHALRGLLLCQRVYYSKLWAKRTQSLGSPAVPYSMLGKKWKEDSFTYWAPKNEAQILNGIKMFVPIPNATAADVSKVAQQGPPDGKKEHLLPGNLFLSRKDKETFGAVETCYNGITAWLLRSGVVSMRWYMRDTALNGKVACNAVFGPGKLIWNGEFHEKDWGRVKIPKAGHICHLWCKQNEAFGWNGHWVVSNGDGTICGVNNGEIHPDPTKGIVQTAKRYTNDGRLVDQLDGYGGYFMTTEMGDDGKMHFVPKDPRVAQILQLAEFNPLKIPNRL